MEAKTGMEYLVLSQQLGLEWRRTCFTSLASLSYSSIIFSFSWLTPSTLQILLAAVSA